MSKTERLRATIEADLKLLAPLRRENEALRRAKGQEI